MPGLPTAITQAAMRTFRPQDLATTYTQPDVQLQRLVKQRRVTRAAHGYYYVRPDDQMPDWTPTLEALAAGIATAIFGERVPVLMHLTAARLHGALPRAIGSAFVAVPHQHKPIRILDRPAGGTIAFVARQVEAIDAVLLSTDLGPALTATMEQTVLDLSKRPQLGGMPEECEAAVLGLLPRCDQELLNQLAHDQRMVATLRRIRDQSPRLIGDLD